MIASIKIKRFLLGATALSVAICLWSCYLVFEKYEIKGYKAGISELLSDIRQKSLNKNYSGTISELKKINGPEADNYLQEVLLPELNVQLLRDPKSIYTVIIPPEEYEAQTRKLRSDLQTRGVDDDTIAELIMRKARPAKKMADYNAALFWSWTDKEKGYLQIILKISGVDFVESKTVITHPLYEKNYLRMQRVFLMLAWLSGGISLAAVLLFSVLTGIYQIRSRKAFATLPNLKEKVAEFCNAGCFVAALNEIDKYLIYLPGNSEVVALKRNLLTKTKDNPENAEKAFNKLKVVKNIIEGRGIDKVTERDLNNIREISGAIELEGVGEIIGKIEGLLHSKNAVADVIAVRNRVRTMLDNGRPAAAARDLEKAQQNLALNDYPDMVAMADENIRPGLPAPDTLQQLHLKVEEILQVSQSDLSAAKEMLNRGEVGKAEELLKKAVAVNRELSEAIELLSKIEKSRKAVKLALKPEKIGREVLIFKKDVLSVFRMDAQIPDIEINAKTVSRDSHLKIAVVDNKVLAEDQGSRYGTKIAGKEIKGGGAVQINDGDVIDFNGAYHMTAHLCCDGNTPPAVPTSLSGMPPAMAVFPVRARSKSLASVVFEGKDSRDFVMLFESIPLTYKSIGLGYDPYGECSILLKDGVFMFVAPNFADLLYPGGKIEYKDLRYII